MKQENPPRIHNENEPEFPSIEEKRSIAKERGIKLDESELEYQEDLNKQISFLKSETHEAITKSMNSKPTGAETIDMKTSYEIPKTQKHGVRNGFMAIAMKLGLAGLLSFGASEKGEGKNNKDSLNKKSKTEKTTNNVETKEFSVENSEQFGISHVEKLESSDTTKDIFLVAIPEYKSYGDVFTILEKAGLKPASKETMEEMRIANEEKFKASKFVISLNETVDKLGNPSYSTMTWDRRSNSFIRNAREIQPIGYDKKQPESNFDSETDVYRFIVELPKKKTADYQSGLVKN